MSFPASAASSVDVPAGTTSFHSNSVPDLTSDVTYTATFTQSVSVVQSGKTTKFPDLVSKKQFRAPVPPYVFDKTNIHSVYPPPGHDEHWNVVPHVLFNDPCTPWTLQVCSGEAVDNRTPWLALIVCTEDELNLTPGQVSSFESTLGKLDRTSTLSYRIKVQDIQRLANVSQPTPTNDDAVKKDTTQTEVVILQGQLFASLFAGAGAASNAPPDATRFRLMSHVRTFNTKGMANMTDPGVYNLAAVNSARIGPSNLTAPKTAYAHLVSLQGIFENPNVTRNVSRPAVLVSLHSWAFTYQPSGAFSATKVLKALGGTIQPLRLPDANFQAVQQKDSDAKAAPDKKDSWVKNRMLSGYGLLRYRAPTGEPTIALQRGLLTPIKYDDFNFPPSDYGSDLAVVDEQSGLLDITFQIAWELGRTMAVADRTFSSALDRLRKAVHDDVVQKAKKAKAESKEFFMPAATVPSTFAPANDTVALRLANQKGFKSQRWSSQPLGLSKRQIIAVWDPTVQQDYLSQLNKDGISSFAGAVPPSEQSQKPPPNAPPPAPDVEKIFDDLNIPKSTDYAVVLKWLLSRWSLYGIPFQNLISDPNFLPTETIRSFYVDQNWFRVFVDGALSICEHFGENDDIREAMKKSINKFLQTPLDSGPYKGFVPQVPKWGLLMRSEFVSKFPDMRISAPFKDAATQAAQIEVLRHEQIDSNVILMLFSREPGDFSDLGISLSPPEHQLTSILGDDDGLDSSGKLTFQAKPLFSAQSASQQQSNYNRGRPMIKIDPTVISDYFDSTCRALFPDKIAAAAASFAGVDATKFAKGGIVAAQLIASVPSLNLLKPGAAKTVAGGSNVVTSRLRPPVVLKSPAQEPKVLRSNPQDSTLSTYPAPANAMIQAITRVDMLPQRDWNIIRNFFDFPIQTLKFNVPQKSGPPVITTPPRNTAYIAQYQPQLSTTIYNLRYNTSVNPDTTPYQTAVVGLYPQSLGFKTHLHLDIKSLATTRQDLSKLTIQLSTGSTLKPDGTPDCLLAPFPTNATPPTISPNSDGEWPAQPVLNAPKSNGVIVPRVRMVGLGQRWWANSTFIVPSYKAASYLNIEIRPNNKSTPDYPIVPAWDISKHKDISLVIEDVQVNVDEGRSRPGYAGPGTSTLQFQVPVYEEYTRLDASSISIGGYTTVSVYGIDVRSSTITPAPRGGLSGGLF